MSCGKDISTLPTLLGCPSDDELFFVGNAIGGFNNEGGARGFAWRTWASIKSCINGGKAPYVGIVDGGGPNDPVSGISTFTNDLIVGLGATNDGNIQIVYAEVLRSNFGLNASFIYDPATGTIDLNFGGSGEVFNPGNSLWIDRNQ